MTTMRIAEVADRSGFSAATLRYYEQLDLLPAPELTRMLASLGSHTPEGPCDSDCGCLTDSSDAPGQAMRRALTSEPVACTLDAVEMPGRLQLWRDLVAHVTGREAIDGGTRLQLHADTPLDELVLLAKAEQSCCSFFAFAITIDSRGVALEVRAPAEGQAMVDSLSGAVRGEPAFHPSRVGPGHGD